MKNNDKKIQDKKTKINNDELFKVIGQIILCIFLSCFFGYCGYTYCIDNNYDIAKGIVFGALFPFVLWTLHDLFDFGFVGYVLLIILWIVICDYIPLFIGIIALLLIILYCTWKIINTYQNRIITEVNTIYKNSGNKTINTKTDKFYYSKVYDTEKKYSKYDNSNIEHDEDEYYCDRCDKKISEEEYIENCGLCEDCDAEVYFGERYDGDDYDLYR